MPPKVMKEAFIFLVNVGVKVNNEVDTQFIDNAKGLMKCVIEKKIFVNKTDEVAIFLMGKASEPPAMNKIYTVNEIEVCHWNMLEKALAITPENNTFTNWPNALTSVFELIKNDLGNSAGVTVIMLSDFYEAEVDATVVRSVTSIINDEEYKLLAVGTKSLQTMERTELNNNEKAFLQFCESVDGMYQTFDKIMPEIRFYGIKQPKPVATTMNLEIGDSIKIPVRIYTYVQQSKPVKYFRVAIDAKDDNQVKVVTSAKVLVDRNKETHTVSETSKGILYGGTFVPLRDEDLLAINDNKTKRSLKLCGFRKKEEFKLEHRAGSETHMVHPSPGSEEKFFALVEEMIALDRVAIVRKVHSENNSPTLKVIYPPSKDEPKVLLMYALPFTDEFCAVDRQPHEQIMKTVTDEQCDIVDQLIDELMLKDPSPEDEDQRTFEPGTIPNPGLQQEWDVLAHRAMNADIDAQIYQPPPYRPFVRQLLERPAYLKNKNVDDCVAEINKLFHLDEEPPEKDEENEENIANESAAPQASPPAVPAPANLPPPMDIDMDDLLDD